MANTRLGAERIFYMHNTYLQIMLHMGLVIFFLYCCLSIKVLRDLFKKVIDGDIRWVYLSIWVSFLFYGLGEGISFKKDFLLYWAITLAQIFPGKDHKGS